MAAAAAMAAWRKWVSPPLGLLVRDIARFAAIAMAAKVLCRNCRKIDNRLRGNVVNVVNVGTVNSRWSGDWFLVIGYWFPEKDSINGGLSNGGIAAIRDMPAAAILAE